MRQRQIFRKSLQLVASSRQHVQRDVQRRHVTILLRQPDVRLRLRLIAVLSLQACRQCGLIHLADGRQVVVADPLPHLQLLRRDDGFSIHHVDDGLHLVALWRLVVHSGHQSHIGLSTSEGHQHTHTYLHRLPFGYGVGKRALQRHRQYDVSVQHASPSQFLNLSISHCIVRL